MVQECSEYSLCSHIYMLPPPSGPESIGVCKLCGVTKIHLNSGNEHAGMQWKVTTDLERKERKGIV